MSPSWQEIDAAFEQAVNLEGSARQEFLAALPSPELRREVESMMAAEAGAAGLLTGLVGEAAVSLDEDGGAMEQVGPWRIVRPLAAGGMGAVYLAERQGEGFRQTAALKLLRPGFDTRFFVSRFRQERRILATLEHPHIAHLLDGGAAADGRPYLALEYVDGDTITAFCADLPRERRVQLFLDVCLAVEHAHQRMVIHRDLKPSNIMVNREGQVKLLDFGIAKMLDSATVGGSIAVTGTGVKLMTPEYAAPEQVRGETITTATDVYCLGLVLYEVLTGRKPLQLPADAPLEAARIVCEQEPAGTGLPPDLDAVIRKCLRKEPGARYAAVAGLREDLERVLRGDAVTAYRGAWTYRAGKWARRYRWGVAAVALVLIAVAGGVIATARQARIAQKRYEDVRQLARTVIFDVYDQVEMLPAATKARETIVNTALRYLEGLSPDARRDPGLAMELAEAYVKVGDVLGYPRMANLGRQKEAVASFQKAKALYEGVGAREPRRQGVKRGLAHVAVRLAAVANSEQRLDEALRLAAEAERLEQEETPENIHRDWALLVHVDHERTAADRQFDDGAACRRDAARMAQRAEEWDLLQHDSNSSYWRALAGRILALSEAFAGDPTRAYGLLTVAVNQMREELAKGNSHIWLRQDLHMYSSYLSTLQSGLYFVSIGDPSAAVRDAESLSDLAAPRDPDGHDVRQRVDELMTRCQVLPAKSQLDAAAGLREFILIRQSIQELERTGQAQAFDAGDYLMLSVGGTRALRRLGKKSAAIAEARDGLAVPAIRSPMNSSPRVGHYENVLRFEQALLGVGIPEAVQTARRYHQLWPHSLLLIGDVVKILSVSGAGEEAARVLAGMAPCEYRRRLDRELRNNHFLD